MRMPRDLLRACYRRLLGLYPRSFRERFGGAMEQSFVDLIGSAPVSGAGLARILTAIVLDTINGIVRERIGGLRMHRLGRWDALLLGAVLLTLLIADFLAFHDLFEPHSVKDWLILAASVLAGAFCVRVVARSPRAAR